MPREFGDEVTIILEFLPGTNRARILAWLDWALRVCKFVPVDVSISGPTREDILEMH